MDSRSTGMANAARPLKLLAYPEIEWAHLKGIWPELSAIDSLIAVHLEIDAKYDVYLKRQTADVDAFRRDEGLVLTDIDYSDVPGLSNRGALESWKPRGRGPWVRRGRLDGLTPAALGILAAYLAAGKPGGKTAEGDRVEAVFT